MPKRIVPLSDRQVQKATTSDKDLKLFDGGGLFLLVKPGGDKGWRLKYRFDGKEKLISLGIYPTVTLADARQKREDAKKLLDKGIDPGAERKANREAAAVQRANTFRKLALEWDNRHRTEIAARTRQAQLRWLEKDVFPAIGDLPLNELTARIILETVLRPLESRTVETAHRVRTIISMILRYGVACGLCDRDWTADLRGAIKKVPRKHFAAVTEPKAVGGLLRAIDTFEGSFIVKCALQLHPLVATRPGELRHMEWSEIDFDAALWSIPAAKMKMKNPHIVPLSPPALSILWEIHRVTGSGKYVFPSTRSTARPISDMTMNAALRRLGIGSDEMVSHGWRAVFRTLADEVLQFRVDIIEAQLSHQVADNLGRAYNRTSFLAERKQMMDKWGEYLVGLKSGAKVIPIRSQKRH